MSIDDTKAIVQEYQYLSAQSIGFDKKIVTYFKSGERAHIAFQKFLNYNVERCPVVDEDGDICGIVTMKDILMGHNKRTKLYFDKNK